MTFVANHSLALPIMPNVHFRQVMQGFDVADDEIVRLCTADDLVITSDIPLAAEVIEKGAAALSSRGERFSANDIKSKLGMRDFLDTMRASGVNTGGPPALSPANRKQFAAELDRWLAKAL